MQRSLRMCGAAVLALCLGLALSGCHNDQRAAKDTARNFWEAAKKGDKPGVEATLTKQAREKALASPVNLPIQGNSVEYTVAEAKVTDDTAEVPVTVKDKGQTQNVQMKLRREDGQWLIYAMSVPLGPTGQQITIDFEHPENFIGDMMRQGTKALIQDMGQGAKGMGEGIQQGLQGVNPNK